MFPLLQTQTENGRKRRSTGRSDGSDEEDVRRWRRRDETHHRQGVDRVAR